MDRDGKTRERPASKYPAGIPIGGIPIGNAQEQEAGLGS
jgi:hypothetical protein